MHALISILAIQVVVRTFAQGRMLDREQGGMHSRVVVLIAGFTPFGLMLFAQRGAHIIPLSPKQVQGLDILINPLLSTTENDQISADEYHLTSASSVRSFCFRFLTAMETRLDAIIFAYEYQQLGSIAGRQDLVILTQERQNASLASFFSPFSPSSSSYPPNAICINAHTPPALPPPSRGIHDIYYAIRAAHPFLITPVESDTRQGTDAPEEMLKAGALYHEYWTIGGVHLGQAVWEGLEGALKEWDDVNPQGDEKAECDDGLSVDTPSS
ncbi:hypothetical protein BDR03DRAFT_1016885 [Suillus americanus]|nr:hypothetical protein BDR03DRAFT_1016885 [Suillus americanus]